MKPGDDNEFQKASDEKQSTLLGEFFRMLKENKKYWLIPLLLVLLAFGLLLMLGGTAVAPFIYNLF